MLFQYRVIGTDGKEKTGSIDALTEDAARQALEDAHYEVLELKEASRIKVVPTQTQSAVTTFAFEGTDASGSIRRGTVQAAGKHEAFEKLRQGQGLTLSMLSPLGSSPQYKDNDLERWQSKTPFPAPAPQATPQKKSLAFVGVDTVPVTVASDGSSYANPEPKTYHPLASTLRLYAGWLLAWYAVFVALGYYTNVRALPWSIPFVQAFYLSPLIFTFVVAIFFFLLFSSLHKRMKGGMIGGITFALLGIVIVLGVQSMLVAAS